MRATRRRRPRYRALETPPPGIDLDGLAMRADYVGSVEHKDTPSFVARQPRPRPDASICPRELAHDPDRVVAWLRQGLRSGQVGHWEGEFPRYVWYVVDEVCYEARLTNAVQGK